MGAWGPGMQANDTALDAVEMAKELLAQYKLSVEAYIQTYGIEPLLVSGKQYGENNSLGILGVAEWVLDNLPLGFLENSSIKYERLILDAIAHELNVEQLKCWADKDERERALLLFGQRLTIGLTDEQQKLVEEYNRGLFDRIFNDFH